LIVHKLTRAYLYDPEQNMILQQLTRM